MSEQAKSNTVIDERNILCDLNLQNELSNILNFQ